MTIIYGLELGSVFEYHFGSSLYKLN